MDGTQIGVFKKANQVRLSAFLQGQNRRTLETKVLPLCVSYFAQFLCTLTNQSLKRKFSNHQICRLLITTNLSKSHSSWSVTVWLKFVSIFNWILMCQSILLATIDHSLMVLQHTFFAPPFFWFVVWRAMNFLVRACGERNANKWMLHAQRNSVNNASNHQIRPMLNQI